MIFLHKINALKLILDCWYTINQLPVLRNDYNIYILTGNSSLVGKGLSSFLLEARVVCAVGYESYVVVGPTVR